MKNIIIGNFVCCFLLLYMVQSNTSTITTSSPRIWDIVVQTGKTIDSMESKVDVLEQVLLSGFLGTFTILEYIENESCFQQSQLEGIVSEVDLIEANINSIESVIDIINNTAESIIHNLQVIHSDDFGGTWTEIKGIETTLCSKAALLFQDLYTVDSKLDLFVAQEQTHFIDTFTTIEDIADDVLNTLTYAMIIY